MEWIGLILQIILLGAFLFWESYNKKKGENRAMKEDSRDINYEGEKGKNLATKEDIDEITKIIESVKNEISFENQRKHTFIEERTNRIIYVLYLAEKIHMYGSLLYFYLNDKYSDKKISILIEDINNTLLDLHHKCRLVSITIGEDENVLKQIDNLKNSATAYTISIGSIAINTLSILTNWQTFFNLANKNGDETFLRAARESIEEFNRVRTEYEKNMGKEDKDLKRNIEEYASLLKILYKQDFYLKFDFVGINKTTPKDFRYYENTKKE